MLITQPSIGGLSEISSFSGILGSLNKETYRLFVADGRDIYQRQRLVEVFLSGCLISSVMSFIFYCVNTVMRK
ncbi:hypothetical protein BTN49_2828 [Candidatus Enterovibrio escicola]|uniref:Uncharacterized protein n=1 Tax=Candidatus Enterovibrio escicola TaxID=1927127 RepID=A0A2A5T074_9GAMM|nr:hypothetical protein BTN49_2828 [Candidatus Enterovibrio escacola]